MQQATLAWARFTTLSASSQIKANLESTDAYLCYPDCCATVPPVAQQKG
jgi:hypothetical protein